MVSDVAFVITGSDETFHIATFDDILATLTVWSDWLQCNNLFPAEPSIWTDKLCKSPLSECRCMLISSPQATFLLGEEPTSVELYPYVKQTLNAYIVWQIHKSK